MDQGRPAIRPADSLKRLRACGPALPIAAGRPMTDDAQADRRGAARIARVGSIALQVGAGRRRRRPRLRAPSINAPQNLARAHIASGFGFWNNTAGFDISQTLIAYSSSTSTFGRAFWVGLLNTLLVAALGIVLATMLGFIVGIARLSRNWLVARLAGGYVELIRNIPLLLQLLFWYNAVLKSLPELRGSVALAGRRHSSTIAACSCRGRNLRRGFGAVLVALLVGIVAAIVLAYLGAPPPGAHRRAGAACCWPALGLIVGLPLAVFALAGFPLTFSIPQMGRFNVSGGVEILPEFAALLFWRCRSIRRPSSPKWCAPACWRCRRGQTEAAQALGLAVRHDAAARRRAAGDAGDHSAADQPISQPDQELLARGRHRLSRSGAGFRRHGAQHHRPGGRGDRHHHGGLSLHQPGHVAADESLRAHASRSWSADGDEPRSATIPLVYLRAGAGRAAAAAGDAGRRVRLAARQSVFQSPVNIALTLALHRC